MATCFVCRLGSGEPVTTFTNTSFARVRSVLEIRKKHKLKYGEIVITDESRPRLGYHTLCYRRFTSLKRKYTSLNDNEDLTPKRKNASLNDDEDEVVYISTTASADNSGSSNVAAKGDDPKAGPSKLTKDAARDGISPADKTLPPSPASKVFTKKKSHEEHDTAVRTRRLMKELQEIERVHNSKPDPIFTVDLVNDNLFEWHVRLHKIDPESGLASDMREMGVANILLHLIFPDNFPFGPPFMRVIEPRIEKGFVMEGGAICMELLTPRGWASAYTIEAVVMQFAASVVKGQGRISRHGGSQFTRRQAEQAFRSIVKTHDKFGWVTPSLKDG